MALMTYAEAAALAVGHAMEADDKVIVLGEDVGRGGIFGQYKGLQQRFGEQRVIDTPISEAAILGAGVGMALAGLRPVVEMRVVDFALCAMDEIANQAAKNRYMFGGQGRVPMVVRMPIGIWDASAAQHSQSLESWFAHLPGLVVVCPATPQDNYSLLRAALDCGDPVVFMEHKTLWGLSGEVDVSLRLQLTIVNCVPRRSVSARPRSARCAVSTSPLTDHSVLCSMNTTGSPQSSAARSSEWLSCAVAGQTTTTPGRCANQLSSDCECCAADASQMPIGMRMTIGTRPWPPNM